MEKELLEYPELLELLLPTFRTDFLMLEGYHYKEDGIKLKAKLYVFVGNSDIETINMQLEKWSRETEDNIQIIVFEGEHFYLKKREDKVLEAIREIVDKEVCYGIK